MRNGGGAAAGILLLFIAVVGLVAFFTGNLERWIDEIATPQMDDDALQAAILRATPFGGVAPTPGPRPPQRVPAGSSGAVPI
jgi:hypothetical protein